MKLTYRVPSKQIQYGYIEVEQEVPDGLDPETLGQLYVNYVHAFLTGEQKGLNAILSAPQEAKAADPQEAAVEAVMEELGATVVSEEENPQPEERPAKPWEKKVDAPAKPWENASTPKKSSPKLDASW